MKLSLSGGADPIVTLPLFHLQIALRPRVQMDILRELGSPDKLRKSLDVVEIVLGFLTSGGGKPKTRLVSYLKKLKMEKKTFSEKVSECQFATFSHHDICL